MAGNSAKLFKLVSMLLVAASLYCAFGSAGVNDLKFWLSLGVVSLIGIAYLILFLRLEKEFRKAYGDDSFQLSSEEKALINSYFMNSCPVPAVLVNERGKILKISKGTAELLPKIAVGKMLSDCSSLSPKSYSHKRNPDMHSFEWEDHIVQPFTTVSASEKGRRYTLLYFQPRSVTDGKEGNKHFTAMLMIDCFDELFSKVTESEKAHATMKIDKFIERFIDKHNGLLKKIDNDHYFAIFSEKEIALLAEESFSSLLEEAHRITVSGGDSVTISMGVGRGGADLKESEEIAREALEMTQGRGGDQVVIKYGRNDPNCEFFGGQSERMEDRSKVKTRIFTEKLLNQIGASDRVIIMGHSFSDMDAVGAAAGLCGAVRAAGFEANVCVNEKTTLARSIIKRLRDKLTNEEKKELFISGEDALARMTENTLLIIVDTNNKEKVDIKEVYEKASNVVYIDHHRQSPTCIDNNVIPPLLDSDASSASELVTEIISYLPTSGDISHYFADALLAGITLDTKNFVLQTRTRTFEAAAYLKSLRADPVPVKKLFANPLELDVLRSRFIENAQIYKSCAVTYLDSELPNIRVAASQAADQLLNTEDVKASFAIYMGGSKANISARSYGTQNGGINVQLLMEKLGAAPGEGGGHATSAGVSREGISASELCGLLKKALDEYFDGVQSIDSRADGAADPKE